MPAPARRRSAGKGGIGTSSRKLDARYGGYTVGVLVQSNYGGVLTMGGAPVGKILGRYSYRPTGQQANGPTGKDERGDGSCYWSWSRPTRRSTRATPHPARAVPGASKGEPRVVSIAPRAPQPGAHAGAAIAAIEAFRVDYRREVLGVDRERQRVV